LKTRQEPGIAKAAGMVMILILFSRILGLLRERTIAEVFGMSWQTDVFRNAFNIPDFMYFLLVAGGLNAAFVPVFSSYLATEDEKEAWKVASTFFSITILALTLFATLGIAFSPWLTPLVGYGFQGEQRVLLIQLMRILFCAVFFTALAGLGMGIHKSYKSFSAPMYGPIAYNLTIIAGTYIFARRLGIYAMALATVVGAMFNFLIQLPFFLKKGSGRFKLSFNLSHPGIKRIFALMGPSIIALSVFQLSFTISANIASGLAEGSASALRVAYQLIQLPLGIFAMGMGMVLLPSLSELAAKKDFQRFNHTFSQGLRTVLFITVPAAIGLAVMREPIIRLLFEVGQFGPEDTKLSALALLYYSIGLFAQASGQIMMQVFFALQDTKTLLRVSVFALVCNTLLAILLVNLTPLGHGALALSWSITVIINQLLYLSALKKHVPQIELTAIVKGLLLSILASGIMVIGIQSGLYLLGRFCDFTTGVGQLLEVFTGVAIGVGTYALSAWALRMEEMKLALLMVQRRKRLPNESADH
jgi:putative peptidoglycan lipid II flippase